MKICFVTSVHSNKDVRIYEKQCVSLADNGYEVYLIAPGESFEENGVKCIGIKPPSSRFIRFLRTGRDAYKAALATDAEIYHLHDPELLPYGVKLKKKGKTVIFDSHEDIFTHLTNKEWIPKILRRIIERFANWYFTQTLYKYDATITVTPHIFRKFEGMSKNNVMITNYPKCKEKLPAHPVFKGNTLCYTGTFEHRNIETVLQAITHFKEMNFILCGKATDAYIDNLKKYAGWKQTIYKGYVSSAIVEEVMKSSDIGTVVLDYYSNTDFENGTLGIIKLFEYMMAGLPVICSDHTLYKEIVERHHCGICIPPGNVDKMVEAISYLSTHPDEATEMGRNGQKAVREIYNWQTQEAILLNLYSKLLA